MKILNRAALWVLLVFLVGTAFGGALSFFWLHHRMKVEDLDRAHFPRVRRGVLNRMLRNLDLDPEQEKQVRQILESAGSQQKEIRREHSRRLRRNRRQTLDAIREVLKPEQQRKLQEFMQQLRRWRNDRRPSRQQRQSSEPTPSPVPASPVDGTR